MKTNTYEGFEGGEVCNRDGCDGIIVHDREGCCSCHINPPCSYCTDDGAYCPKCNWDNSYVANPTTITTPLIFAEKEPEDSGKKYDVRRYFDDMYEATIASGLTYPEACKMRDKYNSGPRAYVCYSIHETKALEA